MKLKEKFLNVFDTKRCLFREGGRRHSQLSEANVTNEMRGCWMPAPWINARISHDNLWANHCASFWGKIYFLPSSEQSGAFRVFLSRSRDCFCLYTFMCVSRHMREPFFIAWRITRRLPKSFLRHNCVINSVIVKWIRWTKSLLCFIRSTF